jgi:hypothetical protein
VTVRGHYEPVALEQIDRVSVDGGKLVLDGGGASVAVTLPASADTSQPTRHWALTTEREVGTGRRSLTFTHNQSVEDFTVELPIEDAEIRFGVFAGRESGEVMAFAWGQKSKSYWGYLTIMGAPESSPSR